MSTGTFPTTTLDESWIVSHYWSDVSFLMQKSLKSVLPRRTRYFEAFLDQRSRAWAPTFVVARPIDCERLGLKDSRFEWQRPVGRDTPILEVKDFDSDETLEEILATCAATRTG